MIPGKACAEEFESEVSSLQSLCLSEFPFLPIFLKGRERTSAEKMLGLDADKKLVLIMGGSMGAGHISTPLNSCCFNTDSG